MIIRLHRLQLGEKVLVNCAAQLQPQLPVPDMGRDMSIALYDYSKVVARLCKASSENDIMEAEETIPLTTEISKFTKDTTHKIKDGFLETLRRCQQEKECLICDDTPLPLKSVTDVKGKRKRNNTPLKKQEAKETFPLKSEISKLDTAVRSGQRKKKTVSFEDPPLTPKSVVEVNGKHKINNTPLKKQAQSVDYGENLVGSRIKVWWPADKTYYDGVVKSFDCIKMRHKVLYDDGYEEILNLKLQKWELVENVSPKSDVLEPPLPKKFLSPQSDIICVQGYNVKNNIAPTLEAIFKKHSDIAANCIYKIGSVRTSFLEVVCEVVMRIQTNNITTIISEMNEIESQVSEAEAAKIDVSWIRAYLADIVKTKEGMENSSLLKEMRVNTNLVKRAARLDLKERREELIAAQERFEKAERCVKVLDLVEKKLTNNILESEAEKYSWAKQVI